MKLVTTQIDNNFDLSVLKAFYRKTREDCLEVFSSDTLRKYELDKYLNGRNAIGGLFFFIVQSRLAREIGRIPSVYETTHHRKIGLYIWNERARKALSDIPVEILDTSVSTTTTTTTTTT